MKRTLSILLLLSLAGVLFMSCQSEPEVVEKEVEVTVEVIKEVQVEVTVEVPTEVEKVVEVTVEVPIEVEVPVTITMESALEVPYEELWAGSGHADAMAEAFVHWDEDDPAEIPERCAKCHSTPGYLDFLGVDGSEAGVVNAPAEIGTTVECVACHNDTTKAKTNVVFPSGIEVMGLGDEARCMECHQGRSSTLTVDNGIAEAGVADDDTVSEEIGFSNIHYYAAAATQAGGTAMGGYQYAGKPYDGKFAHVEEFDTCIGCHDSHTLQVKVEACQACHEDVTSIEDMVDVRMLSSAVDYDGDGDIREGIAFEIEGLRDQLYAALQQYATEVAGTAVAYESHNYPYFFIDGDGDGAASEEEANYGNRYKAWTGRLAKAAYNYQTSLKDPGAYAHGGKYIIQLLYDSIEDINQALSEPVDMANLRRIDHGHFAGSEEAFRHWDEDGMVPGRCSKCHSAEGLPLYLEQGVTINQPVANGLLCSTCHVSLEDDAPRYEVASVEFPSGLVVEDADSNTLLCMNCHQGRSSTVSVNNAIDGLELDDVSEDLRFLNVHYFAAGATRYGTEAKGAYEYDGQDYNGYYLHDDKVNSCVDCHDTHAQEVKYDTCLDCHEGVESAADMANIRKGEVDYDGNGDVDEGIAAEIEVLHTALYTALQAYASDTVGTGIVYNPGRYPYFFTEDGERYATWTPRLLQAAYNYQYVAKDPGAYAHNPEYVLQVMYDSLTDLGADVDDFTRPELRTE